jgi:hypothetical protein
MYVRPNDADGSDTTLPMIATASLFLTAPLGPSSSTCTLKLYYHMYGQTDNLLIYLIEGENFEKDSTVLVELNGDQGDKWLYLRIPLGRIATRFRIGLNADRLFNPADHDLAVDDIGLEDCDFPPSRPSCPADYFRCARQACVPMTRVCDLTDDCGDGSDEKNCKQPNSLYMQCDFEDSMCNWMPDNSSTALKWELHKGSARYNTGPSRDHTLGLSTGQYAYVVRGSLAKPGDRARLISPVLQLFNSSCNMRLFYHMNGADLGEFYIKTRSEANGVEKVLYSIRRETGNAWERIDVSVDFNSNIFQQPLFQMIIEAVLGTGSTGHISIDDISFTPSCYVAYKPLPVATTIAPLTTTKQVTCDYDG